jgi:hypothetical protein
MSSSPESAASGDEVGGEDGRLQSHQMTLVDELHALQDRLTDLPQYEKLVLDLAAVLAEELVEIRTGSLPEPVTTIALEH